MHRGETLFADAGGGESGVMARVLETLGVLARVSSPSLRQHIPDILPLVIEALNDISINKKAVAITTLGHVRLPHGPPPFPPPRSGAELHFVNTLLTVCFVLSTAPSAS